MRKKGKLFTTLPVNNVGSSIDNLICGISDNGDGRDDRSADPQRNGCDFRKCTTAQLCKYRNK